MKIAKKDQRKEFKNSDCCLAYEYPMDDCVINGALIKLSGRYPDKGWAINEVCKEMGYIISGSGKLAVEDKEYEIGTGDLILINPGEKFYWQGNMEIFMACAPAWTPDQCVIFEIKKGGKDSVAARLDIKKLEDAVAGNLGYDLGVFVGVLKRRIDICWIEKINGIVTKTCEIM